jgi:Ca-activated chloride channel family protein
LLLIVEALLPERKRDPRQRSATAKTAGSPPGVRPLVTAAVVILLPLLARASSSSALREYKNGHYDQAFKEYERMIQRKQDDPKLHFNAGTAAYRSKQYETAIKEFNESMSALDLKLLQEAYYNRGNSLFYLGDANPDPEKKQKNWEDALKDFENTVKLNQQDTDAHYNLEFVKKKIEELKQQQRQKQDKQKPPDPSEEAKKAKETADEAVKRREYPRALEIMENQLKKDPTTAAYSDYIQRLKEITGVQQDPHH